MLRSVPNTSKQVNFGSDQDKFCLLEQNPSVDSWYQRFPQLQLSLSSRERIFWCAFNPAGRPCFNLNLLQELRQMQSDISGISNKYLTPVAGGEFDFMVVCSATPGVYNLGGDLSLFRKLVIERRNEDLRSYAQLCVDVVRDNENSYGAPITTIAQVAGSCLGGGFEAALSCDVIIAEENVKFGFPEILFGLFPGMGAINFISRRVSRKHVLELILSGKTFSAKDLCEIGLVDYVCPRGRSKSVVQEFIKRRQERAPAYGAVHSSLRECQKYTDAEFDHIIDQWVGVAMNLSEKDLNKMLRLANAQERKLNHDKKACDGTKLDKANKFFKTHA